MSLLHPITQNLFTIGIKNVWLFRALGLTLMNAVIFFINTLMDTIETKRHLEDENNQLKINNLQTELAQLKNQINPHFLFNALSSLKSLMR
jgi:two-component system LytT family sensor kinase